MPETLRLITLDLDETLWPCFPTIMAAERSLFAWIEAQAPALAADHSVESLRDHRIALAKAQPQIAHDMTEVRLRSLQSLAELYGLDNEFAHQGNALFRQERNRVQPYEDVIPALQALRENYVLISISNGNAQVEHTPLAECFHYNFLAEEVGAAKPHPALFEAASEAANVPLSQALHVGDDPFLDIQAASNLGMRTAWVNRHQAQWPAELAPPDQHVSTLDELCLNLQNPKV